MGRQTRPAESRGGGASPFPAPSEPPENGPGGPGCGPAGCGTAGPWGPPPPTHTRPGAGSVSGRVPYGNTGRTSAGLFTPMPIPQDLRLLLGRTDLPVEPALAQGPVEGGARQ
ncbi:DUF3703 domain-containing protein [Streptomyces sp. H27-H1]|uniref:DUF3703 domain-containing protein n=1 Tax=Streptomyces sp. H27-H1 TaxID=2996461 RepID=UPI003B634583